MSKFKVVITVPEADADNLRQAIGHTGGGQVGSYSFCSFSVKGTGRFIPGEGANPAIGEVNKLEEVSEERVEINCTDNNIEAVLSVIRSTHPYEQPVIDVYKLEDYAD